MNGVSRSVSASTDNAGNTAILNNQFSHWRASQQSDGQFLVGNFSLEKVEIALTHNGTLLTRPARPGKTDYGGQRIPVNSHLGEPLIERGDRTDEVNPLVESAPVGKLVLKGAKLLGVEDGSIPSGIIIVIILADALDILGSNSPLSTLVKTTLEHAFEVFGVTFGHRLSQFLRSMNVVDVSAADNSVATHIGSLLKHNDAFASLGTSNGRCHSRTASTHHHKVSVKLNNFLNLLGYRGLPQGLDISSSLADTVLDSRKDSETRHGRSGHAVNTQGLVRNNLSRDFLKRHVRNIARLMVIDYRDVLD